ITSVAGSGAWSGFVGDGGPATAASFDPTAIAIDGAANVYIADYSNNRIRKVAAATGIITTLAGSGQHGFSGDGGPATAATLSSTGIAVDEIGNSYIVDALNNRIRTIATDTGIIMTMAGN